MTSPFKFLDPFEYQDRDAFFGREAEVKELYSLVTKNRITFLYGPSGIGKTSLIRCGLASRFNGADWIPIFMRPSTDINVSLREALGKTLQLDGPYNGPIGDAIRTLFNKYLRPVYLIFDQFEELFIYGETENDLAEQHLFYETIYTLLEQDLPYRIIFSMREDYFGHLSQFEKVVPELYARKLRIEPMTRENLLRVITGSCETFHIGLGDARKDPHLILENLLTSRSGGHIPFIQVYLHMLYVEAVRQAKRQAHSDPIVFNRAVIEAVGPIQDVLGRFLKDREREIHRILATKGFEPPEDIVPMVLDVFVNDEGTRMPVPFIVGSDGESILQGRALRQLLHLPPVLVSTCVEELEKNRILHRNGQEMEIAHDTLAAFVDRHRSDEQRQITTIQRRIEVGYREYMDAHGSYFFNNSQLARIEPYLDKIALEPGWQTFLDASREYVRQHEQAKIREANEKLRRQRIFSGVLALFTVIACAAAGWALRKQKEATAANARAMENLLIAQREKAEAQQARDIARTNEQRAIDAETDARQKADTLAQTLFNLGKTTEQVVDALMTDAASNIYRLEYEAAIGRVKTAVALGRNTPNLRKIVQEIAFFKNESRQTNAAARLLTDARYKGVPREKEALRKYMQRMDAEHYRFLQRRYLPPFDMATVPEGTFEMGSDEGEEHEQPKHKVQLSTFHIARTETTVWQFALYAAATGRSIENFTPDWGLDGDNPMVRVSWYDAVSYSNWLSRQMGLQPVYETDSIGKQTPDLRVNIGANGFRLPTEAQWEYAAVLGHADNSSMIGRLDAIAWHNDNCDTNGVHRTRPVATRHPNTFGIYDLGGNVWEWCQDWYGERYYEAGRSALLINPYGPAKGVERVYRGGSWKLDADYCRFTLREFLHPSESFDDFGFRLVR